MLSNKLYLGIILLLLFGLSFLQAQSDPTVKDADGNVYKTVKIGKQVWIAENLKATKYNDGTAIALTKDSAEWVSMEKPCYCWYENNETKFKNPFGALYNWHTLITNNICPAGWHVPSVADWTNLVNFLGSADLAGGKLKETGIKHWLSPNTGATNSSGFNALPGGCRNFMGSFSGIKEQGFWWAKDNGEQFVWCIAIYNNSTLSFISNMMVYKNMGQAVRCLKD